MYYNTASNTQHECTAANNWVDLGLGGGSGGGTGGTGASDGVRRGSGNGANGPAGLAGQGYTWRGTWISSVSYLPYDTVFYSGSSWLAVAGNSNVVPGTDAGADWNLVAQQGSGAGSGGGGAQRSFVVYRATNTTPITCNGTVQTVDAYTVPANTLQVGDVVDVFAEFKKGGTTGSKTLSIFPCRDLQHRFAAFPLTRSMAKVSRWTCTTPLPRTPAKLWAEYFIGPIARFIPHATIRATQRPISPRKPFTVFAQQGIAVSAGDSGSMYQWWIRVSR